MTFYKMLVGRKVHHIVGKVRVDIRLLMDIIYVNICDPDINFVGSSPEMCHTTSSVSAVNLRYPATLNEITII